MPSLSEIRENKRKNSVYKKYLKYNYKSPEPLGLVASIIKEQNKDFILEFLKKYNLSDNDIDKILKECIKPNYYCPQIVQKKEREHQQLYSINSNIN